MKNVRNNFKNFFNENLKSDYSNSARNLALKNTSIIKQFLLLSSHLKIITQNYTKCQPEAITLTHKTAHISN